MPTRVLGYPRLTDILSGLKEVHGDIVLPLIFIGFFIFGGVACLRRGRSRRAFVSVSICILLVTSQLALVVVPFVHAHRYSHIADQTDHKSSIFVADSSGDEIEFGERANSPLRSYELADAIHEEWNDNKRLEVADQILSDANSHRERIKSPVPWLRHPPPSRYVYWDESTPLEQYDQFEIVRVYQIETIYKENSHQIKERSKTCLVEVNPYNGTITEGC